MQDYIILFFPVQLNDPYLVGLSALDYYLKLQNYAGEVYDLGLVMEEDAELIPTNEWEELRLKGENSLLWSKLCAVFDQIILKKKPRLLGFSLIEGNESLTKLLVERSKKLFPETPIVVGGCGLQAEFPQNLDRWAHVDFAVVGSAEITLAKLLEKIKNNNNFFEEITGLHFIKNKKWILASSPSEILPLNQTPIWDMSSFSESKAFQRRFPNRTLLMFNKGCTQRCSFCLGHLYFNRYEEKSVRDCLDFLSQPKWQNRMIHFCDASINANPSWLRQLAQGMIERNLKLSWRGWFRLESSLLQKEVISNLIESGCLSFDFGLESASSIVLAHMRKFSDEKSIYSIFENIRQVSREQKKQVKCNLNILVGYPIERDEDFQKTLKFLHFNADLISGLSANTFRLAPQGELWQRLKAEGITISQTTDSDWLGPYSNPSSRLARLQNLQVLAQKLGLKLFISHS